MLWKFFLEFYFWVKYGPKDLSSIYLRGVLTSSAAVGLLGEQLLDLLGEVALGAPHEPDHTEDHEHRDEAEPEGLLQHALAQANDVGRRVRGFTPDEYEF